jgi:hypothetical protein
VAKARAAGAQVIETSELLSDLERLKAVSPDPKFQRYAQLILRKVREDREVLLEGEIPAAAIKSPLAMGMTRGVQVLGGVGIILTAYDLTRAGIESEQLHSARPITEEAFRQAGGWAGAIAVGRLFAIGGAAVGIETGPGAVLTAAVGAVIGGVIGFFGAEWAQDWARSHGLD